MPVKRRMKQITRAMSRLAGGPNIDDVLNEMFESLEEEKLIVKEVIVKEQMTRSMGRSMYLVVVTGTRIEWEG